jgi:hypothetical protein
MKSRRWLRNLIGGIRALDYEPAARDWLRDATDEEVIRAIQTIPRHYAISWVQGNSADAGSVNSTTLSVGTVTAHNNILVGVRLGGTTATATIADGVNAGNYAQDLGPLKDSTNGEQMFIFSKSNCGAGSTTLTITITGGPVTCRWCCEEYNFGGVGCTLDKTQSHLAGGSNTTIDSTATATTTQANELLFGVGMTALAPTYTAGTGFTLRHTANRIGVEDQVVSATGAYNATFTLGAGDAGCYGAIATYYANVAASATFSQPVMACERSMVDGSWEGFQFFKRTVHEIRKHTSGLLVAKPRISYAF